MRRAIGAERIALFGLSYGTKVAAAYALKYPRRVERLALDSVVEPGGPSALNLDSFAATPRVLRALCRGGGCRQITADPAGDLEQLVAKLSRGPLRGTVMTARGKRRHASLGRRDLFALLLAGDLLGGLRPPFPAAVRSALRDDPAPFLRLQRRAQPVLEGLQLPPRLLSVATNVATTCEEAQLPWVRVAPFEDRRRQAGQILNSLPASVFRPFDRLTALDSDLLTLCERWPASASPPTLAEGPAPDVPALLLEGEDDLRTPVESARRVAARFPSARLLVQEATGHIAILSEDDTCALRALQRFFSGRSVPAACPRVGFRLQLSLPCRPALPSGAEAGWSRAGPPGAGPAGASAHGLRRRASDLVGSDRALLVPGRDQGRRPPRREPALLDLQRAGSPQRLLIRAGGPRERDHSSFRQRAQAARASPPRRAGYAGRSAPGARADRTGTSEWPPRSRPFQPGFLQRCGGVGNRGTTGLAPPGPCAVARRALLGPRPAPLTSR